MHRHALGVILMFVLAAGQAWGQTNPPPRGQKPDPNNPWSMWDIQQMIERATNEVTKRYNLTPEQTEFTRNLMVTRVNAFLDKHEQKIREIFGELMRMQMAGQDPPAAKVQEWTDAITPMFDEAKAQIVDGNKEFREILTDDQKKIHDIDLKVMEQNFADAQKRLDRWREGGFDPAKDMGRPAKPAPSGQAPAAAGKPAPVSPGAAASPAPVVQTPGSTPRATATSSASTTDEGSMDAWEAYVRKFIENYKLDAGQSSQAMRILGESRNRAEEYRASRKNDYQKIQMLLASDPKSTEARTQMKELDKPIGVVFSEMKARLEQIPTDAQRKAFEKASFHGKAPAGVATRAATSQPTASQPASRATATRFIRPIRRRHSVPAGAHTQPAGQQ